MNSTSTDWFAVAAYDRDKSAPAPASGFCRHPAHAHRAVFGRGDR